MTYKRLLSALLLIFSAWSLFAQKGDNTVKVKLTDTLSLEPVSFATIYLSKDGSTSAYYAVTDADGKGMIKGVPAGKYMFVADMVGYRKLVRNITVDKAVTDLGELFMSEDVEMLDAVVVSAVGNPIVVKKDTIEYSAAAYKTTDNDVLEDLLKKLPGVDVDSDGAISYQGETINKIMIGGKEFFLDDPSLASKNIPAQIIQKVVRQCDGRRRTRPADGGARSPLSGFRHDRPLHREQSDQLHTQRQQHQQPRIQRYEQRDGRRYARTRLRRQPRRYHDLLDGRSERQYEYRRG